VSADKLLNAGQWAIIAGLVGARIYEVIFNWDYYGQHPWKIPAVWEGGLAIHGGLIAGILTGLWVARREGLPIRRSLDIVAPSIAIGQAIGRWGNFFNEEAFGTPTDLPWRLYISPQNRPLQYAGNEYFHPTFLYESLWDALGFVALIAARRRLADRPSAVFYLYIGLYSVGRFLIESIRVDSFWVGSFRVPSSRVSSASRWRSAASSSPGPGGRSLPDPATPAPGRVLALWYTHPSMSIILKRKAEALL